MLYMPLAGHSFKRLGQFLGIGAIDATAGFDHGAALEFSSLESP